MTDLPTIFDIPAELRTKVDAIREKYRLQLGFQLAEELLEAGLDMHLCFHVAVLEHRVAAARLAVMACAIEKREPRRDLYIARAGEDIDEAKEWLAALQADGGEPKAFIDKSENPSPVAREEMPGYGNRRSDTHEPTGHSQAHPDFKAHRHLTSIVDGSTTETGAEGE